MLEPTRKTIERLFFLTGNRCAFPKCMQPLVDEAGNLVAEVCHICGDKPGSQRYDAGQSEEERRGYDNLIVLCPTHHAIVDNDPVRYNPDVLRIMKRRHEATATGDFNISDTLADRIALMLGGVAVGSVLGE